MWTAKITQVRSLTGPMNLHRAHSGRLWEREIVWYRRERKHRKGQCPTDLKLDSPGTILLTQYPLSSHPKPPRCVYKAVLVSCSCYNKLLLNWWLRITQMRSLTVLGAKILKSAPKSKFSARAILPMEALIIFFPSSGGCHQCLVINEKRGYPQWLCHSNFCLHDQIAFSSWGSNITLTL